MQQHDATRPEPYDACATWAEFSAAADAFEVGGTTRSFAESACTGFADSEDHIPALCETEFGTTASMGTTDSADASTSDSTLTDSSSDYADSGDGGDYGSSPNYTTGSALAAYISDNVQALDSTSVRAYCPDERLVAGDALDCQVVFSDGSYKTVTVTVDSVDASGQVSATLGVVR